MRHRRYKKPIKFQTLAIITGACVAILMIAYQAFLSTAPAKSSLGYDKFKRMLENNEILSVDIIESQDTFTVETYSGEKYRVINPDYDEFKRDLLERGVDISIRSKSADEAILQVVASIPMTLVAFAIIWFLSKSFGGQAVTLFKVLKPEDIVTFDDVAGMSETKEEVEFAVSQIKNRRKLRELGARPCKGIILEGPPGTGKTLLAKAIAGEAGVPFISTSGADFIEMFAGLGAARVRALWDLALTNAPCVVFIDEIDAVGRRRTAAGDSASQEGNQTLNALLQRMDGLGVGSGIFVVAATNRIEDLDPALLRPGRFDKHLYVGPPKTKKDRDEIINVHIRTKKLDEGFDFDKASKLMFSLTGAEIEQVLNEAVLVSIHDGRDGVIKTIDIDKAVMKLKASGVAIKHSSEADKKIASVHEAGHAMMTLLCGRKVGKVSIMPYSSGIGGMTVEDADSYEDRRFKTKEDLINDIKILLAGRESENLILGSVSVGSSNDIERASILAFNLINNFGMYDDCLVNVMSLSKIGVGSVDYKGIITKMEDILKDCQSQVRKSLEEHRKSIESIANTLLEEETIINIDESILK